MDAFLGFVRSRFLLRPPVLVSIRVLRDKGINYDTANNRIPTKKTAGFCAARGKFQLEIVPDLLNVFGNQKNLNP